MKPQDGAVLGMLGRDFEVHVEPPDEDGHGAVYVTCLTCDGYVGWGDDAMQDHECFECPGCGEHFPTLPVIDSDNGQGYCTDECHENASERFWMAVYAS